MPDGDIFTPLGRGYATAGRQLAHGLDLATVALTVIRAMCKDLNAGRPILPRLLADLCAVVEAARLEQEQSPHLAANLLAAYEHWRRARDICREYRRQGAPLTAVAEAAMVQVLVAERQSPSTPRNPCPQTLAAVFAIQLFEQRFAGKIESMLQSEGLSASEAQQRAEQCRAAVLASPHFERVVTTLAKRPGAKYRVVAPPGSKQTTAQVLDQSLGSLLAGPTGRKP